MKIYKVKHTLEIQANADHYYTNPGYPNAKRPLRVSSPFKKDDNQRYIIVDQQEFDRRIGVIVDVMVKAIKGRNDGTFDKTKPRQWLCKRYFFDDVNYLDYPATFERASKFGKNDPSDFVGLSQSDDDDDDDSNESDDDDSSDESDDDDI